MRVLVSLFSYCEEKLTKIFPRSAQALYVAQAYPQTRNTAARLCLYGYGVLAVGMLIVLKVFHHPLSWGIFWGASFSLLCALIMNCGLRIWAPFADPILYPTTFMLLGLSTLMQLRLDYEGLTPHLTSQKNTSLTARFLIFILWGCIFSFVILSRFPRYSIWSNYSIALGIVGIIFLFLPLILPEHLSTENTSRTWILTPWIHIQGVEVAKLFISFSFAGLIITHRKIFTQPVKEKKSLYTQLCGFTLPQWAILGVLTGIAALVILTEHDIGAAMIIFFPLLILLYCASENPSWLCSGAVSFILILIGCYKFSPIFRSQMRVCFHPLSTNTDIGYQISQSLFGLGTGGLAGTGLGLGRPTTVPYHYNQFILTSFGEELGEVGLMAIVMLYFFLITVSIRTALHVRNSFGKLLSTAIAGLLLTHILIALASTIGVFPISAVTAPLLSHNCSSVITTMIALAVLAQISSNAREPASLINNSGSMIAKSLSEISVYT